MIKNIVFDMGNVLVRYDSMRTCRQFMEDEEERNLVNTSVFVSPEWIFLDMGVISEDQALKKMQARLPEGHARGQRSIYGLLCRYDVFSRLLSPP